MDGTGLVLMGAIVVSTSIACHLDISSREMEVQLKFKYNK